MDWPDISLFADVVLTTPTAATYVNARSARTGSKRRTRTPARKCASNFPSRRVKGARSYFAVESYGGMVEKALAFIDLIANHAAENVGAGQYQRSETLAHARAVIAASVVRVNTRLVEKALRMA